MDRSPVRLDRPGVEVGVEEDDGVGEDEDGVGGAEAGDEHLVAGDVPPREHLHHLFDFLSLAWIVKENVIEADWQWQEKEETLRPNSRMAGQVYLPAEAQDHLPEEFGSQTIKP